MTTTAQLLITCILDTLYPEAGEAIVRVLKKAGVRVEFPAGQTCCGQPAYNAGLPGQAYPVAVHTIEILERTRGPVVVPSGSCAGMMRHGYLELFAKDPVWLPRAQALAVRIFEFSEFLVDVLGIVDLGAHFPGRLAYHASCHLLRDLGVDRQPRALLQAVQGAELVELPGAEECCGFGGVFSAERSEISTEMLRRKMANVESSQADLVVSCDAGCITNINGGLHRLGKPPRAVYIAQILDRSDRSGTPKKKI
jgi:L-lactate dehydrogenase complex protein LldE